MVNEQPLTGQHGENKILNTRDQVNEVAHSTNLEGWGVCLPVFQDGKLLWCCQGKPYCNEVKYNCDIICEA